MTTSAVQRSVEVEATPEEVWELLVDDDERAGWFGGDTTLDPVPGGQGEFTDPDGTRRTATVDEVEPPRRLSWTWWTDDDRHETSVPTRVDVDLTPTPAGGTRVSITEAPLVPTAQASALTAATGPLLDLELLVLSRRHAPVIVAVG